MYVYYGRFANGWNRWCQYKKRPLSVKFKCNECCWMVPGTVSPED